MCTKIVVFFMRVVDHCVLRDRCSWVLKYHWWIVWRKKFVFRILCQTQALIGFALSILYSSDLWSYLIILHIDFYLLIYICCSCLFVLYVYLYMIKFVCCFYLHNHKKKKKNSYIIANKDDIIAFMTITLYNQDI